MCTYLHSLFRRPPYHHIFRNTLPFKSRYLRRQHYHPPTPPPQRSSLVQTEGWGRGGAGDQQRRLSLCPFVELKCVWWPVFKAVAPAPGLTRAASLGPFVCFVGAPLTLFSRLSLRLNQARGPKELATLTRTHFPSLTEIYPQSVTDAPPDPCACTRACVAVEIWQESPSYRQSGCPSTAWPVLGQTQPKVTVFRTLLWRRRAPAAFTHAHTHKHTNTQFHQRPRKLRHSCNPAFFSLPLSGALLGALLFISLHSAVH